MGGILKDRRSLTLIFPNMDFEKGEGGNKLISKRENFEVYGSKWKII